MENDENDVMLEVLRMAQGPSLPHNHRWTWVFGGQDENNQEIIPLRVIKPNYRPSFAFKVEEGKVVPNNGVYAFMQWLRSKEDFDKFIENAPLVKMADIATIESGSKKPVERWKYSGVELTIIPHYTAAHDDLIGIGWMLAYTTCEHTLYE